jgi:hypothetical protein
MATGNFNMDDPSKQEAIRRGHHEYIPTAGKHGSYQPRPYRHQEYPKMLGTWPQPQQKDFLTHKGVSIPGDLALQRYQAAMVEWDRQMSTSVVNNPEEEAQWLKENG